jgi:hypothetical protein
MLSQCFFETFVPTNQSIWCHNPDEFRLNLKFHSLYFGLDIILGCYCSPQVPGSSHMHGVYMPGVRNGRNMREVLYYAWLGSNHSPYTSKAFCLNHQLSLKSKTVKINRFTDEIVQRQSADVPHCAYPYISPISVFVLSLVELYFPLPTYFCHYR